MELSGEEIFQDFTNKELARFVQCATNDGNIYNQTYSLAVDQLEFRMNKYKENHNNIIDFLIA